MANNMVIAMRKPRSLPRRATIGLLMDCDTTGVEPDLALVKFKKLAGGGYFKIGQPIHRAGIKESRLHAHTNQSDFNLRA